MTRSPNDPRSDDGTDPGHGDPRHLLGARVRAARVARGWTQRDLGAVAGLHPAYVGSVERGERNIGFDNLVRLAEALDLSLATLLRGV